MGFRSAKRVVIALGLLGAMAVQANEGRSFDSYSHEHRLGEGLRAEGRSFQSVAAVPEPSEWLFLGLGLVLIGAVAYRRQSKLLGK